MKYLARSIIALFLFVLIGCNTPTPITDRTHDLKPIHSSFLLERSVLLSDLKQLSSDGFEGRKIGSSGSIKAQNYITQKLEQHAVKSLSESGFLQSFTFNNNGMFSLFDPENVKNNLVGNNIVAIVEGHKYPQKYIVLTAHYDHLGSKGRNVFNGADDNASGVAALLSYAYLINKTPLAYSVIFLFTDGEEQGLKGAYAFIEQNENLVKQIILNINIDMIAGDNHTRSLHFISHDLNKLFETQGLYLFEQSHLTSKFKVKKGFREKSKSDQSRQNWHHASDHGAFRDNNIPYIYYGVGNHKNYHTINDDFYHVNHEFYYYAANQIFNQLLFVDKYRPNLFEEKVK